MTVTAHTLVSSLMNRYPYLEDVLAWHGVTLDDSLRAMSLYALCWVRGIELQQLLNDIDAMLSAEEDPTDEMTADDWTDEGRKPVVDYDWSDSSWDYTDILASESADMRHREVGAK